ncbi:MAG: methyltransferase family protein [Betaproteobacteria bacterium]
MYYVMVTSVALIAAGLALLTLGWATVHRGRDTLVTGGVYRYVRHPQYLGLILIVLGFNIQWPTIPTLVMAPILIFVYVRLARREDEELSSLCGKAFRRYAERTPAFIPWRRHRHSFRKYTPYSGRRSTAKYYAANGRRE